MTNFNFDFSVLPAAPVRGGVEPPLVGVFAALVNAAPRALGIKEIIAVAVASGIEVPAETTVRTYLNRAAEDGRIVKPTRQTYAAAGAVEGDASEADAADEIEGEDERLRWRVIGRADQSSAADEIEGEDDPLAGL